VSNTKLHKLFKSVKKGTISPKFAEALYNLEHHASRKKQIKGLRKKVAQDHYRQQQKSRRFIICFHDGIREVASKLTTTQAGALMRLLPYMQFKKDNLLVLNSKPMTLSTMAELIGKSERTTRGIIKVLIEAGALTN
jgi:hypothetical protein